MLPAVTLAAYYVAVTTRLTRSGMLEVLGQDFIRTARAKGLGESATVLRHGLRNALIPITTVLGLQIGELLAGAVVTETVFAWPGVGTLVLDAITRRDYPVVQATIVLIALVYARRQPRRRSALRRARPAGARAMSPTGPTRPRARPRAWSTPSCGTPLAVSGLALFGLHAAGGRPRAGAGPRRLRQPGHHGAPEAAAVQAVPTGASICSAAIRSGATC